MKFAYLILAYKNFEQLRRFIKEVANSDSYIFIHLDAKVQLEEAMIAEFGSLAPNLRFIPQRRAVYWGGFSLVDATLELMRDYLASGFRADFVHICSDSDKAILPRERAVELLSARPRGMNYLKHTQLPSPLWRAGGMRRLEYRWYFDYLPKALCRALAWLQEQLGIKRTMPSGVTLYGGANWMSLTHEVVKYIAEQSHNKNELYRFCRLVSNPDEIYIQTLIMNSPFSDRVVNDYLRFIKWEPSEPHPILLAEEQSAEWSQSSALFARKFIPTPIAKATLREQIAAAAARLSNLFRAIF